jgi:hypothetical protein
MSWKPELSVEEASALCGQLYGVTVESVEALPGYDDAVPPPPKTQAPQCTAYWRGFRARAELLREDGRRLQVHAQVLPLWREPWYNKRAFMNSRSLCAELMVCCRAGFLDMQNQSMEWLVSKGLCAPAAVPSVSGSLIPQVTCMRNSLAIAPRCFT